MGEPLLYIFDTTDGTDGAPCLTRIIPPPTQKRKRDRKGKLTIVDLPPFDPAVHIGADSAVAIESNAHGESRTQELELNADGETIDTVPGFSRTDHEKVKGIRAAIRDPLLDAIGLAVVDIAKAPEIQAVLAPETKRLLAKIESLLRVTDISDGPDLDEASGKVDEVEAILATRPARPGRGGGRP